MYINSTYDVLFTLNFLFLILSSLCDILFLFMLNILHGIEPSFNRRISLAGTFLDLGFVNSITKEFESK